MIDARIIANFVLDRADERGQAVTNLDLQKIVYFVHGHYLTQFGEPLVIDAFEAWNYGPVHRTVYDAFKEFNDTPIDGRATAFDPVKRQRRELPNLTNAKAISVINRVLGFFSTCLRFSGSNLPTPKEPRGPERCNQQRLDQTSE